MQTIAEQIPQANAEENSDTKGGVFFTDSEWKYFKREIEEMIKSDRKFSLEKAVRNARYLAEIERRDEDLKAGKNCVTFTDEEWEAFINAQDLS